MGDKTNYFILWFEQMNQIHPSLLAERFTIPTRWCHYCTWRYSSYDAENGDDIAKRSPQTKDEENKIDDNNNCTKNETCIGHVVAPSCK